MESQKFFSGLFDFSFKEFVTPKIIRVLYIILIIAAAIGGLGFLFTLSRTGAAGVILGIIAAVVGFFFFVILYRVYLEVVSALFRINENVAKAVQLLGGTATALPHGGDETGPSAPPAAPTTPPPPTEIPPTTPPPPPEAPPPSY